ncbi:hypothetical protein ABB55_19540 [Prosthecomicrobium hirschii]|uniref:DNA helicase n=1 Tax=Prosthecodimorpha hirschii TaxID=665126 RepID=A0A0P6W4G3_9HYPH|nr:DUF4011 domain-containing protein [Prosthecomicrobium hirschii]KPL54135.1 hypothetical protein ABB55_19540 [Prosthecomicrobium hirschii]
MTGSTAGGDAATSVVGTMLEQTEKARLGRLYEQLRLKLLDLTKRNRMLSYPVGSRSKRQLQIVDEVLEEVYGRLTGGEAAMRLVALPEPDTIPADEKTEEFLSALDHARASDVEYLVALEGLQAAGGDNEAELDRLEQALRRRLRVALDLPPRPERAEINRNDHARALGIEPNPELGPAATKPAHGNGQLQTLKYPEELESVLEKIHDEARLAEQESGLSTLFLAFGFLEWYESETSDKPLYAPLILLPVRIERERLRGKEVYALSAREPVAEGNISLQKLLEDRRYGRILPDFAPAEDEEGDKAGTVEAYFEAVRAAVEGLPRWRVRRWLVLGHFSFARIAIYEDTRPERWTVDPVESGLVGSLLAGFERDAAPSAALGAPPDYPIDDPEIERITPILIQDADASQHSALVDVMQAKNLVIQGPPGTGKSQTITNVIANALAAGQSVLFLAEKQAALDVVKRRLDGAGLGHFCLELHSEKSSPKAVVKSLADRCDLGVAVGGGAPAPAADPTWRAARAFVSDYVEALHAPAADRATPFSLIWSSIRGAARFADGAAALAATRLPDGLLTDPVALADLTGEVETYAYQVQAFEQAFGPRQACVWSGLIEAEPAPHEQPRLIAALDRMIATGRPVMDLPALLAEFGPATLDEALALVTREAALPAEPPPDPTPWAGLDPMLACAAGTARIDWLDRDADHAVLYAQIGLPDDLIARAPAVLAALPPRADAERSPAELFAQARRSIAAVDATEALVAALLPALDIAGLDDGLAAEALGLVAKAIVGLAVLTPLERRWYLDATLDDAAFDRLQAEWSALARERGDLMRLSPALAAPDLPEPAAMRKAAAALRRSWIGRLVGRFDGSMAQAEAIAARASLVGEGRLVAAHLDRLAEHVERTVRFETDRTAAQLFGSAWAGLATPFEPIARGRGLRRDLEATAADRPGLAPALAAILALDAERAAALAGFRLAGEGVAKSPAVASLGAGAGSIRDLLRGLGQQRALWTRFLAADPDQALAASPAPLARIARAATLDRERSAAADRLAATGLADRVTAAIPDMAAVPAARSGLDWLAATAACGLPAAVQAALVSAEAGAVRARLAALCTEARNRLAHYEASLVDLGGVGLGRLADLALAERFARAEALVAARHQLADVVALQVARRRLAAAGLDDLLDRIDAAGLPGAGVAAAFAWVVARRRAERARQTAAGLARSNGGELEARRRIFAERDRAKIRADRETVRTRLLTRRPPDGAKGGSVTTWTEMALLRNELPKQKRFVPVRSLVGRAAGAILSLKPCFMMSPLSLAKFLPPGRIAFDLLVIDEASQMRPEDALGAMLRARQMVVVGDPRQLPPTSFFERSGDAPAEEAEADDVDDESILERCQKVFGEVRRLKWHYRSRCESLIRFSNETFYDNGLITFPAARPGAFSIDLVRVDGTYQARRNPAEAERIAEEAIAFMRHHAGLPEDEVRSLGIVTLNTDQRDLVGETLRRFAAGDEAVERYGEIMEKRGEPLFVKNLENVQGDERDFIFISLTYGREAGAKAMKQRFGPINTRHGARRLNVLFSRARLRIGLFASFGSIDVVPTETSRDGVHVLRNYLEYAETRGRAAPGRTAGVPDSDFEVEVARRLEARGYRVVPQVGVSGYRIDLGIRHPDRPETYLAGIECDGAAYHSSRSARDRDRLREEVLRGLGWDILRVWSTDWFEDPGQQTDRLVRRLEDLRARTKTAAVDYVLWRAPPDDADVEAAAASGADSMEEGTAGTAAAPGAEDRDVSPGGPEATPVAASPVAASGMKASSADGPAPEAAVASAGSAAAPLSVSPVAASGMAASSADGPAPEAGSASAGMAAAPLVASPVAASGMKASSAEGPAPEAAAASAGVAAAPIAASPVTASGMAAPSADGPAPEVAAASAGSAAVPVAVSPVATSGMEVSSADGPAPETAVASVGMAVVPVAASPVAASGMAGSSAEGPAPEAAVASAGVAAAPVAATRGAASATGAPALPADTRVRAATAGFDPAAEIDGTRPLTEREAFAVLAAYRETVIRPAAGDAFEAQRSILREAMIETLVRQRIADPDDWFVKVPQYLRTGTSPMEKRHHLDRICTIVARIA